MSYSNKDLTVEIKQIINEAITTGTATSAAFIAMAIVSRHPFPHSWSGAHRDFAKLCVHGHVRNEVHNVLRPMKKQQDEGGDAQLTMEGFERLQRAYIVENDGDLRVVRTDQITDAELLAKADHYDAMAAGCAEHASEIRRYVDQRRKTKIA
jgi:hypothetical protein